MKIKIATWAWAMMGFCSIALHAQTIPDQINSILSGSTISNNSWTILIENDTGSVNYYQRSPTTGYAPASNTKIFTTSAALGLLGTNHYFETRIYTNGTFSGGVLTGDLNLVSEHDMTWNTSVFSSARAGLDYIAGKLKTNGLTSVVGNVQCYGVCFYNRGSTDTAHTTDSPGVYNGEAATAFKAALIAQGISVSGTTSGQSGFNPPGGLFYTHKSSDLTYGGKPLRLDIACIPLMKVSHNVMADELLRHIGYKLAGTDSYTAGANKVVPWLGNPAGVTTNGIVMEDGSGLSHNNRFSARQILTLDRYMLGAFPSWDDGLPIGCVDGTISGRFCGTDGSGKVHAKTGSLSISIALSGYIDNKYDNRRYLFSFVANRASIDQTATRNAIDACVVVLGGRGEPLSPQLLAVTNIGNGTSLKISWSDEKFIRTGYKLYPSADGINFNAPITLATNIQSYTDAALLPGQKKYYRVTVVNGSGESQPSRVYGAQAGSVRSKIIVVDGNDRWQVDPTDNPSANSHNFCAIAGQNISGPAFDTATHNAVLSGTVALTNYSAVIWLLGEESTADETFSSSEQTLVTSYLSSGGNLFVSGAEIGWDLDRASGPTADDRLFYHNQLRAVLNGDVNDDANTYAFTSVTNGIFSGNVAAGFDDGTHGTYNVAFPDVLTPTNDSVAAILYSGGLGGAAAVTYDGAQGGGKLVNFGFPFETITNSAARDAYMSDVLRFFGLIGPPQLLPAQFLSASNSIALSWSANAGLKYRLQYKTNLSSLSWTDVVPDVTATNTIASQTQTVSGGQKFYRVLLVN